LKDVAAENKKFLKEKADKFNTSESEIINLKTEIKSLRQPK
jgi:hypothetical protein